MRGDEGSEDGDAGGGVNYHVVLWAEYLQSGCPTSPACGDLRGVLPPVSINGLVDNRLEFVRLARAGLCGDLDIRHLGSEFSSGGFGGFKF